jgi:hypothetical protein
MSMADDIYAQCPANDGGICYDADRAFEVLAIFYKYAKGLEEHAEALQSITDRAMALTKKSSEVALNAVSKVDDLIKKIDGIVS